MKMLEEAGWQIKHGQQYSLSPPNEKRFIRLDTLGDEYSEQAVRDVLAGKRKHEPAKTRRMKTQKNQKVSLIIDVQQKLEEGKGKGYEQWAKVFNVKQLAASLAYLSEHKIESFEDLTAKVNEATARNDELLKRLETAEDRLQEIAELKRAITGYLRTKEIYAEWKKQNYSESYYAAHERELTEHKSAKRIFDKIGGKIPTVKELSAEYAEILKQKQQDYAEYRENRSRMRELLAVRENVAIVTGRKEPHRQQNNKREER